MEVTRKNFKECLGDIAEVIQDASFIAIDGEFTGLDIPKSSHSSPFDTPEERYHKIRKGCCEFLMIQCGVCAFKYDEKLQKYEARPYNFYIFPRPYSRQAPDHRFLCQSSSMDFLVSQGFDFNKLFREGISYLTPTEEGLLRESLQQKHQYFSQFSSPAFASPHGVDPGLSKGPVTIPDEHKEFIDNVCEKVATFLEKSDSDTMELPPCSAFQRKLIYQTVRLKHTSGVHLETKTGEKKERCIVVTRVKSENDMKTKEAEKQAAEVAEIDDAVGFTKVVKMISQSGKLVIGHNMMLDLVHVLHQFCYQLPESYEDFKAMTKCAFPRLLDTKLMANTNPFKDRIFSSTLGEMRKILEFSPFKKPEVVFPEGFDSYDSDEEKLHEAGYDAYITGMSFISMANYLGTFQSPPKQVVPPTSALIEPFVNKMFQMRSADIPYMDLNGPDLQPNRSHVFHVTFPPEWKAADLHQLFLPFGNIQLSWLDDTSAFVSLYKKDNASQVLKTLCQEDGKCQVISFEEHKKREKGLHPDHVSRKRPVPSADVYLPSKKRKSLNADAAPFVSHVITSIPEETSEVLGEGIKPLKNGDQESKRAKNSDSEKVNDGKETQKTVPMEEGEKKLFEEPEVW